MQRFRSNARLNAGLSSSPSARALIIFAPPLGSFDQNGTRPHRNVPRRRVPSEDVATAYASSVGATLKRAPRSGATISSMPKYSARSSAGVFDVKRPHTLTTLFGHPPLRDRVGAH